MVFRLLISDRIALLQIQRGPVRMSIQQIYVPTTDKSDDEIENVSTGAGPEGEKILTMNFTTKIHNNENNNYEKMRLSYSNLTLN